MTMVFKFKLRVLRACSLFFILLFISNVRSLKSAIKESEPEDGPPSVGQSEPAPACAADQLACDNGRCVSVKWRCDGDNDCGDNSDEINCTCKSDEFGCGKGGCVSMALRCDGNKDCRDSSDEINCPTSTTSTASTTTTTTTSSTPSTTSTIKNSRCKADEFSCTNGVCILNNWKCDNYDDCGDNSDEFNCSTTTTTTITTTITTTTSSPSTLLKTTRPICDAYGFQCSNGRCKPSFYKCDGYDDCGDNSDELNCDCSSLQFRCLNGRCKYNFFKCDGNNDCGDNSDEMNCQCSSLQFRCLNGRCKYNFYKCDGNNDCGDNSDEMNCPCQSYQFRCSNGLCKSLFYKCDGNNDCGDNSDEINCTSPTSGCGVPTIPPIASNLRIVGGVPARPHSWPWQVSIHMRTYLEIYDHNCGGSIINEITILTAAHCMFSDSNMVSVSDLFIVAGDHNLETHTEATAQYREVAWFRVHEQYIQQPPYPKDIAIIILKSPLLFNDHVSPICLPSSSIQTGQDCYATGWGDTKGTGVQTTLNQVRLPIIDLDTCKNLPGYSVVGDSLICAGYLEGGKSTCQGDSGGPLVCKTADNKWYLDGITSWGMKGCSNPNSPSVFTRTFSYLNWIHNITKSTTSLPSNSLSTTKPSTSTTNTITTTTTTITSSLSTSLNTTRSTTSTTTTITTTTTTSTSSLSTSLNTTRSTTTSSPSTSLNTTRPTTTATTTITTTTTTSSSPSTSLSTTRPICDAYEFQCSNGRCKPSFYKCDGEDDCRDNSDELNCECSSLQFRCLNGRCKYNIYKCDGNNDCGDNSDEMNCPCQSFQFRCSNGLCKSLFYKCDGNNDCGDNSDEINCTSPTSGCGVPTIPPIASNLRIVGGVPARPHSWPWQVSIHMRTFLEIYDHNCGGSIINEITILTAAHCMFSDSNMVSVSDLFIVAGDHNLETHTEATAQYREVAWFRVHEQYIQQPPYPKDIAIIILKSPLLFNDHVSPICLPSSSIQTGQDCYATGWGDTKGLYLINIFFEVLIITYNRQLAHHIFICLMATYVFLNNIFGLGLGK